jgi:hypothetical protein
MMLQLAPQQKTSAMPALQVATRSGLCVILSIPSVLSTVKPESFLISSFETRVEKLLTIKGVSKHPDPYQENQGVLGSDY